MPLNKSSMRNLGTRTEFRLRRGLQPIKQFDVTDLSGSNENQRRPPLPVPIHPVRRNEVDIHRSVQTHLLITSLLEQMCCMSVEDSQVAQQLFRVICEQLSKLRVISPLTYVDEMSSSRAKYRLTLHNMIQSAKRSLIKKSVVFPPGLPLGLAWPLARPVSIPESPVINDMLAMQTSRYRNEFQEICRLGKGGFGSVFKARNRLDQREYAVKKIKFKHRNAELLLKLLREVKALAGLSHSNIVGYNGAWLEHDTSALVEERSSNGSHAGEDSLGSSDSESYNIQEQGSSVSIEFRNSNNDAYHPKIFEIDSSNSGARGDNPNILSNQLMLVPQPHSNQFLRQRSANSFFTSSNLVTLFSDSSRYSHTEATSSILFVEENDSVGVSRNHGSSRVYKRSISCEPIPSLEKSAGNTVDRDEWEAEDSPFVTSVTLYIQMELCNQTLADWLAERNKHLPENDLQCVGDDNMRIFHQLLHGVDYIHSQGLMHRDLKPRNVFLQGPSLHVKIGDFGLATEDIVNNEGETILSPSPQEYKDEFKYDRHTSEVGTFTYAAPEQLCGCLYDSKCDIYSMGVILFEQYCCYKTEMERHKSIGDLKEGCVPDGFRTCWPGQTQAILKMIHQEPKERPSTKELLISDLFLSKDQIISNLKQKVEELESDRDGLQRQLQEVIRERNEKDKTIARLQEELNVLRFEDFR